MRTMPLGVAGLLAAIAPAAAQNSASYALTVSVHRDAPPLKDDDVADILRGASAVLQGNGNGCSVTFTLKGHVQAFSNADASAVVSSRNDRDAVYRVTGDVKVVKDINYCNPNLLTNTFNGCSYPFGSGSSIITHIRAQTRPLQYALWAHEFGHRTGLEHRGDDIDALMSGCGLSALQRKINPDECQSFLSGPCLAGSAACSRPPPLKQCPDDGPK